MEHINAYLEVGHAGVELLLQVLHVVDHEADVEEGEGDEGERGGGGGTHEPRHSEGFKCLIGVLNV